MVIDIHAHVSAPRKWHYYRSMLLGHRGNHGRGGVNASDEELESALQRHLSRIHEAGTDMQFISPRPNLMMHYAKPEKLVRWWMEETNNIIARQVKLHPDKFRGVCGLPQSPGESPKNCFEELERCVKEFGFIGCLINPDPGEMGGEETPAMGDEFWYPLYEKLVELDIPALVHSSSCQSSRMSYSLHFITEESIAIMSLLDSQVFKDFPSLKLIISHGGGAIPYQMGRFMASRYGRSPERFEDAVKKLHYDTCIYTKESLELLFKVMGPDRCMFSTENPGTGSKTHPDTGRQMDDLKPVIEEIEWLTEQDRRKIFEDNARKLFKLDRPIAAPN